MKNEGSKGRGGDRLKLRNIDGNVPLSMRSFDEQYKDSSSKRDSKNKTMCWSNDQNSRKDNRCKAASGRKDLCGSKTTKTNKEHERTKEKDNTFIVLPKHEINSFCERIEEMICELEHYRWDAVLLNETWRLAKSEIWETHHKHILMGAGKYDNKQGVGIMLNKKWRQKIIDTECISESANGPSQHRFWSTINASIWWAYTFPTPGMPTITSKKCTEQLRSTRIPAKSVFQIVGGEFNAELGSGCGGGRTSVGPHTLNVGSKKGDWLKHWLMLQNFTALKHEKQKDAWKTNDLQISWRNREANRLNLDQEKTPEIQQRCWSQRHDSHGQRPQMCHGYIRDQYTKSR